MIALTDLEISTALNRLEHALPTYCWIQARARRCNVSTDAVFQKRFNGFYRVRRDARWHGHFYDIMESAKPHGITFREALRAIRVKTGRLEPSFASKLVATLDPSKPVIEPYVLERLDLALPRQGERDRESQIVAMYDALRWSYDELLRSPVGRTICQRFDRAYPDSAITDLKKIDLVLWQARPGA